MTPDAFQPWLYFGIIGIYTPISQTSFHTSEPIRISHCKSIALGLSKAPQVILLWVRLRDPDPEMSYSP